MARTANPYVGDHVKYRAEQWQAGYAGHREGLTLEHNPYHMPGFVRRWREGWKASEADAKRGVE